MLSFSLVAEALTGLIYHRPSGEIPEFLPIIHKISQCADDTSLTVVGDESIERLAYHLDLHEKASGAKVNREKYEGLWLGSNQNRTDKPLGFKWQTDKIKVLGIHVGNTPLSHTVWDEKIDKFIKTLHLRKMRDLSLKGKTTVINILTAACLWYPAYVYHIPAWALKKLNEALWTFLWGNKGDQSNGALPCYRMTWVGSGFWTWRRSPKLLNVLDCQALR